jgi:hypothetical protein
VVGLVLTAGLDVFFRIVDFGPHPAPLLLLVLAGLAMAWLVYDALGDTPVGWQVRRRTFAGTPGQDARTAGYLRLIEGNLTAAEPSPALRDRLARLADQRLRQRHGFGLRDPRSEQLLGPDVLTLLTGPPRRCSTRAIDQTLTRIEEL